MQEFLPRSVAPHATPDQTEAAGQRGLQQALGIEKVSVLGIPATTHFAQILVEADYRMKLIGIELEPPASEDGQLRRSG